MPQNVNPEIVVVTNHHDEKNVPNILVFNSNDATWQNVNPKIVVTINHRHKKVVQCEFHSLI